MPSTYTTNLGIEKIATGEQSGTWGTTTNTNFDLLDTAINGIVSITLSSAGSSGSPNDLPITDGTASNGRNKFIEFIDGGDLGATAYVQLTPNDAEKIVHIRNSLSGSRSIIVFQGTYNASNDFEIPNGADVTLKFNGGGSGATVTDVNVDLTVTGLTATSTVSFSGATIDNLGTVTTVDINGGTIDGTVIGGSSAAAGTFTTFTSTGIDDNATSTAITIDSDGDVGIGVSPAFTAGGSRKLLQIANSTNGAQIAMSNSSSESENPRIFSDSTNLGFATAATGSGAFQFYTAGTERMRIDSSGKVGIGMTANSGCLLNVNDHIRAENSAFLAGRETAALPAFAFHDDTDTGMFNVATNILAFSTGGTERMRISSAGDVQIGTAAVTGGRYFDIYNTGSTATDFAITRFITQQVGSSSTTSADIIKRKNGQFGIINNDTDSAAYINFTVGTTERMHINSSGNVGIGTSSPTGALTVSRSSSDSQINLIRTSSNTANGWIWANSNKIRFGDDSGGAPNNTRMCITTDTGRVGIGTSNPSYKLDVDVGAPGSSDQLLGRFSAQAGTRSIAFVWDDSASTLGIGTQTNHPIAFHINGSSAEKMRLDTSGRVCIGTTSGTELLNVAAGSGSGAGVEFAGNGTTVGTTSLFVGQGTANEAYVYQRANSYMVFATNSTERMRITASGQLVVPVMYSDTTSDAANVNVRSDGLIRRSTSSRRYKNDITDATHGLTELLALRSVTYKGNNDGDRIFGGLIAEEVHEAGLTEFVQYDSEGNPDALAYGHMIALCVKAIQELTARVAELEGA